MKRESPAPLSLAKRRAFLAITLSLPFVVLVLLEISLRAGHYGGDTPLFEAPPIFEGRYLGAGQRVAARFFPSEKFPPSPPNDVFFAEKPAHVFRAFALGESSAAGFPYPPNAMFSRVVADALRDVMPRDTIEVVNLGISATNSYALVDFVDEILAQKPDAIFIYAGHNEYYGALGVGSTESLGAFPGFVRLYLRLQRFKTVLLLRTAIKRVLALGHSARDDENSPSRMESVARNQRIFLGGRAYEAGKRQYESNLSIVLRRFHAAHVPVFIASLTSNLRDQPPLAILSGDSAAGRTALATFDSAATAGKSDDTLAARKLYARARDLDPVRFRAPGDFTAIVRTVANRYNAYYVPVEERFASAAILGVPGHDLILEHVHPNSHGYALMGQTFFEAIQRSSVLGNRADFSRLRSWSEYESRMRLTEFDQRIAYHEVQTVTTQWPFVRFSKRLDYRGSYTPRDYVDSMAFFVSRGGYGWAQAKSNVAMRFEKEGKIDSAIDEYEGLIRDFPHSEGPLRLAAKALLTANQTERAIPYLERAVAIQPTAYTTYALGVIALRKRDVRRALTYLQQSLTITPNNPDALYQLSLAFAFAKDADNARATAIRLAEMKPDYPGLQGWLSTLGISGR